MPADVAILQQKKRILIKGTRPTHQMQREQKLQINKNNTSLLRYFASLGELKKKRLFQDTNSPNSSSVIRRQH